MIPVEFFFFMLLKLQAFRFKTYRRILEVGVGLSFLVRVDRI